MMALRSTLALLLTLSLTPLAAHANFCEANGISTQLDKERHLVSLRYQTIGFEKDTVGVVRVYRNNATSIETYRGTNVKVDGDVVRIEFNGEKFKLDGAKVIDIEGSATTGNLGLVERHPVQPGVGANKVAQAAKKYSGQKVVVKMSDGKEEFGYLVQVLDDQYVVARKDPTGLNERHFGYIKGADIASVKPRAEHYSDLAKGYAKTGDYVGISVDAGELKGKVLAVSDNGKFAIVDAGPDIGQLKVEFDNVRGIVSYGKDAPVDLPLSARAMGEKNFEIAAKKSDGKEVVIVNTDGSVIRGKIAKHDGGYLVIISGGDDLAGGFRGQWIEPKKVVSVQAPPDFFRSRAAEFAKNGDYVTVTKNDFGLVEGKMRPSNSDGKFLVVEVNGVETKVSIDDVAHIDSHGNTPPKVAKKPASDLPPIPNSKPMQKLQPKAMEEKAFLGAAEKLEGKDVVVILTDGKEVRGALGRSSNGDYFVVWQQDPVHVGSYTLKSKMVVSLEAEAPKKLSQVQKKKILDTYNARGRGGSGDKAFYEYIDVREGENGGYILTSKPKDGITEFGFQTDYMKNGLERHPVFFEELGFKLKNDGAIEYPDAIELNARIEKMRKSDPARAPPVKIYEFNGTEVPEERFIDGLLSDPTELPIAMNGAHHHHDLRIHLFGYLALPKEALKGLRERLGLLRKLEKLESIKSDPNALGAIKQLLHNEMTDFDSRSASVNAALAGRLKEIYFAIHGVDPPASDPRGAIGNLLRKMGKGSKDLASKLQSAKWMENALYGKDSAEIREILNAAQGESLTGKKLDAAVDHVLNMK